MRLKILVSVFAVVVAACGGGGGDGYGGPTPPNTPVSPSTSNAISVRDNSFSPNNNLLSVGATVTWTWTGSDIHNVTFTGGPASIDQSSGTYQRTFGTAGVFNYNCTRHGAGMSGRITIQ
jgi:plastocyanin